MIGNVHSSDTPKYVPQARANDEQSAQERHVAGQPPGTAERSQSSDKRDASASRTDTANRASAKPALSEPEQVMLRELKQRDQQVRQHELAHIAASGGLAQGGPSYTYQRGPDGQNYAIGGQVSLDVSPDATPKDTLQKARTIRRAAMAPAEPSGQDRAIAAKASQMEGQARIELLQQQVLERRQQSHRDDNSPAGRLAQRFFSAITPAAEPFVEATA